MRGQRGVFSTELATTSPTVLHQPLEPNYYDNFGATP